MDNKDIIKDYLYILDRVQHGYNVTLDTLISKILYIKYRKYISYGDFLEDKFYYLQDEL